ncbi:hypothetical protein EWB00_009092 [Schistosoma japonicum]|uniref:SJCHGC05452 protein n=1 Tax=Schistosoma japonicum TaxID=6182 RepID=Q86EV8_SCHJA|nr:SJCHGC05452 protein [Schistosoma japonicum]KAH8865930.1 hypothetical protein KSF78_0003292 [Schistosoma japonicum]TNN05683.1 hypothetical protein EWB00_009092 [Schistosoma japonicum]CAX69954.1 hypothetical protein [Schistosoma japonicum]
MRRQMDGFGSPCISEREFVKLQYSRKIAQDTCLLATMKTPDWSQTSAFVGKHSVVPCTVTTNSGNSTLKMYPYSVYSCACPSDLNRFHKYRSNYLRHRCFSGPTVAMLLPAACEPTSLPRTAIHSSVFENCGLAVTDQSIRLSYINFPSRILEDVKITTSKCMY